MITAMKKRMRTNDKLQNSEVGSPRKGRFRIPIAIKIILSFLLIIALTSLIFTVVGSQIIGNRVVSEAQEKVGRDLNSAREIYLSKLNHLNDIVRLTADRFYIKDALISGDIDRFSEELVRVKVSEKIDLLTITDPSGIVLLRANNIGLYGDNQSHNELVSAVMERYVPVAGTVIMPVEDLMLESQNLVEQAHFNFIYTPMARIRNDTEQTSGMMLEAAAPIFDYQNNLIGILYGGILLNRNYEIVDEIKRTVFQDLQYKNQDIGTATIFQDDLRISTNVKNGDGSRAIGTRVSEEVYNQVVVAGKSFIGRAYVVNNWYITAYEPIKSINHRIIGILYVGILEQKYVDIRQQTIVAFLTITLVGALVSMFLAYFISRSISRPINLLVSASGEVANGNLETRVENKSNDELGELADTFNSMASALKERDEKLKEFTKSKIMESERLALIGQLSANVAHELNNPLQGIVTYSHLLLEELPKNDPARDSLEKIVTQANRSRDIIRGLLDFSRQRKPDKTLCDVNDVMKECVSLLEKQALFHNIQITMTLDENLPSTIIDPSQIERVFINMIINAADAMEGNGKLSLTTRVDPSDHFIEVEFKDTGHGIAKENMERIFDPFFTTKDTGRGVGLGLAISFGIVKEHNGTISVESEVGKGTTFLVRLPVTKDEESVKDGQPI
jgi:two-component system NtrC family sensor kinase